MPATRGQIWKVITLPRPTSREDRKVTIMGQRGRPKGSKNRPKGSVDPVVRPVPAEVPENQLDILGTFTDKQQEAVYAFLSHKYLLYGGALAGGKSHLLRWLAAWYNMYLATVWKIRIPKVLIVSSTYRTLTSSPHTRGCPPPARLIPIGIKNCVRLK